MIKQIPVCNNAEKNWIHTLEITESQLNGMTNILQIQLQFIYAMGVAKNSWERICTRMYETEKFKRRGVFGMMYEVYHYIYGDICPDSYYGKEAKRVTIGIFVTQKDELSHL